ncbi:MAG: endonuclease/exonuclease/phosphatase family protein [Anaerosomatales bacterium]|nr:endonuclease/exonuclease/phosphatase family protein [Anaerosomatales bacterium]
MRIVSWNCNGSFRTKYDRVASFDDEYGDDVLVIQEAEHPDLLPARLLERYPNHIFVESARTKGLLVLGSERFKLAINPAYDETYRFVVPVAVTGECEFLLIAVWGQKTPELWYTDYVLNGLKLYEGLINDDTVVAGDFNSTPNVKKPRKSGADHADLVCWLEAHGLRSAYHEAFEEEHGSESHATYAHRRDLTQPFHIDYLFASERALRCSSGWHHMDERDIALSDHLPLFVSPGITRTADRQSRQCSEPTKRQA